MAKWLCAAAAVGRLGAELGVGPAAAVEALPGIEGRAQGVPGAVEAEGVLVAAGRRLRAVVVAADRTLRVVAVAGRRVLDLLVEVAAAITRTAVVGG